MKDLVITAVNNYGWPQIRPFAISLDRTGFAGDKVVLAGNLDSFTRDCLLNRDYQIVPFNAPTDPSTFVIRDRFIPLLKFLKETKENYRCVIWVDAGDQIFQVNPSTWFDEHPVHHTIVAAREGWKIKDETTWNDPWVKAAVPEDWDWLREHEVLCGGTVAGDPGSLAIALKMIYDAVCKNPTPGADQALLNYFVRKPFGVACFIPELNDGWAATLSSVITENFHSCCGFPPEKLGIAPPIFDTKTGLVMTPDGNKPFVLVHQYNRDGGWTARIHAKYREW